MADQMPDPYDRLYGSLDGLPDVVHSRPSTIRTSVPIIGSAETWIVQTFRQTEVGDTIFLEAVSGRGSLRLAIPPAVAEAISRQREALTTKNRKKAAKRVADERKAAGIMPFGGKGGGRRKAR